MTLLQTLKGRGLIHDVSHFEELEKLLEKPPVTFYCGFDPTADSLHVGSMVPLLVMRRLQKAGHQPLALIGSATGMIGDPSGRSEERKLLDDETVEANVKGIEKQIALFLSNSGKNAYRIVKNHEWINQLSCVDFLREVGKHFSVNMMLAKDSVKSRLENREQGISYTEFSYMLLQAYDFFYLHKNLNCRLQVGGSDQWGNITGGIELIRRKNVNADGTAYGCTFPLLTTSTGTKFGKTEHGTVWLDGKKTSPYRFFQYWLNTADADAIPFLKLFTELSDSEIEELSGKVKTAPQEREAQMRLAFTLTELIHGKGEAERAVQSSRVLFGGSLTDVDSKTLLEIFGDVPSTNIPKSDVQAGVAIQDLLVRSGLAKSKGDARRLIEGGGVYANNERVGDAASTLGLNNFIDGSVLVLRSGKKNYHLIRT